MKNEAQYLVLVREDATKSKTWGQFGKLCQNFKEKKNHTVGLAIPPLRIYPWEVLYIYKYVCTKLFIAKMLNRTKNCKLNFLQIGLSYYIYYRDLCRIRLCNY